MNVPMTFETTERAAEIDRLLAVSCREKYDVTYKPAGTPEHLTKKIVLIHFAATRDRDRFRSVLRGLTSQAPIIAPLVRKRSLIDFIFGSR